MSERKKPRAGKPVLMRAALDVLLSAQNHSTSPDEYHGRATYYFDDRRSIEYKTRWHLKTEAGGRERIRREAVEYLTDLRNQIDEVLAKLETAEPDEYGGIHVWASVYDDEPAPKE